MKQEYVFSTMRSRRNPYATELVAFTSRMRYTDFMPRADRIKEEIGWLKVVFTVSVALDATLVAWLAQNYATAGLFLITAGCIAALFLAGVIVFANHRAYRRMNELEEL